MRAVVQRVREARVSAEGILSGGIGRGLLVYLGVAGGDDESDAVWLAEKVAHLRVFDDAAGRMNRSVLETSGAVLAVSQFTLLADARKGRRPFYGNAAEPGKARGLYDHFVEEIRRRGLPCETGVFQARMEVSSLNDGPVTILLDSREA